MAFKLTLGTLSVDLHFAFVAEDGKKKEGKKPETSKFAGVSARVKVEAEGSGRIWRAVLLLPILGQHRCSSSHQGAFDTRSVLDAGMEVLKRAGSRS